MSASSTPTRWPMAASASARLAATARDLGAEPWERWQRHRFDLSAERLKSFLEPAGAYLDTIELAASWTALPELHARVKTAIAVGGLALCHFSHAYEQGCCAYFTFGGSADSETEARAAYLRAWEGAMSAAFQLSRAMSEDPGFQPARPLIADPDTPGAVTAGPSRANRDDVDGLRRGAARPVAPASASAVSPTA